MNRKGFTLIEVLAVIIILGIILVVAVPNISNIFNNSKLKSEDVFINRLSTVIDGYVKLNTDTISFTREADSGQKDGQNVTIYGGTITINNIINESLLLLEDYVNAGNKDIQCNPNAEIEVYKDSDFVYCHKVEASELNCITEDYIKSICPEDDETCYVIDTCIWSR